MKKRTKYWIAGVAAFAVALTAYLRHEPENPNDFQGVSVIQLIATPEKFDGQKIGVRAFFVYDPENRYLYLSKDHFENGLIHDAVEINLTGSGMAEKDIERLNKQYVWVTGTFYARARSMNRIFVAKKSDAFVPQVGHVTFFTGRDLNPVMLSPGEK